MRKSTSKRREAEQRRRRVNPAKIFSDRESNHGQADFFSAGFFGFGIKRIFGGLFDGKHEWATQIVSLATYVFCIGDFLVVVFLQRHP